MSEEFGFKTSWKLPGLTTMVGGIIPKPFTASFKTGLSSAFEAIAKESIFAPTTRGAKMTETVFDPNGGITRGRLGE
jgi:hypothetical protein